MNTLAPPAALVLQRYKFIGSAPTEGNFATNESPASYPTEADEKIIYQWVNSGTDDQAYDPTMAVDDNLSSIPGGVASPADPYANNTSTLANTNNVGDIYVSWASMDNNTAIPIAPFNPNRVTVEVSSDGGNNFSPATIAGAENLSTEEDASPALTISQGRLPSESGVSGDTGITAGQVAVTFDDFGDSPQAIHANTITPGTDNSFGDLTEKIITEATTTYFPIGVTGVTSTSADPLDNLDVTVNIVDSGDQFLGLTLVAPDGASLILVYNQVPTIGGTADTGIGISGSNVGVGRAPICTRWERHLATLRRVTFSIRPPLEQTEIRRLLSATSVLRTAARPWTTSSRPRSSTTTLTAPGRSSRTIQIPLPAARRPLRITLSAGR